MSNLINTPNTLNTPSPVQKKVKKQEPGWKQLWNKFYKYKMGKPKNYEAAYIKQNDVISGLSVGSRHPVSMGPRHQTMVSHTLNLGAVSPEASAPGVPPELAKMYMYNYTLIHSVPEGMVQLEGSCNPIAASVMEQPMVNNVVIAQWTPSSVPTWFSKLTGTRWSAVMSPEDRPLVMVAFYNGFADEFHLEGKYKGQDYKSNFEVNSSPSVRLGYQQRISHALSAGVQFSYIHKPRLSNLVWDAVYEPSPESRGSQIGFQYKQKYKDGTTESVYNISYSEQVMSSTRMRAEYNLTSNGKSRAVYSLKHDFVPLEGASMKVMYDSDHTLQSVLQLPLHVGEVKLYSKWEDKPSNYLSYGIQFLSQE